MAENAIFDEAVALQLTIMRVSASVRDDVLKLLRRLERELISMVPQTDWDKSRVDRQLSEIRSLIREYYDEVATTSTAATAAIGATAAKATANIIGGQVLASSEYLEALAGRSVIQGAGQGAWWAKQSADLQFKFAAAVRQGLVAAETNQQIVRRARDVLDVSRREAATLVQTSVATIANDARELVFERNQDIIKGYRAVATLDSRTCLRCAPLDGLRWDKDKRPIGHNFQYPDYPLHFSCRCLTIAVVFDGPPQGTRSSADGQVSANLTFDGWLERQSKERQDEILGKGRAELYRSGKITLTDLVAGNRPLTLDQLRAKYDS